MIRLKEEGAVQIARKGGQLFMMMPIAPIKSPLDVTGVDLNLSTDEIVGFVREGRDRLGDMMISMPVSGLATPLMTFRKLFTSKRFGRGCKPRPASGKQTKPKAILIGIIK